MKTARALPLVALSMGVAIGAGCTAVVGVGDYKAGDPDGSEWFVLDSSMRPPDVGGPDDGNGPAIDAAAEGASSDVSVGESSAGEASPGADGGTDAASDAKAADADGGACPSALCGDVCCGVGRICVTSGGTPQCAQQCADNFTVTSTCGSTTSCCMAQTTVQSDGGATWNGQGACVPAPAQPNGGQCLCTTTSECPGGSCTPVLGHYTCQPDDGAFGHGCHRNCGGCYDCVVDCNDNHWCAWSFAAGCPAETCPAGFCIVPHPSCDNLIESCAGDCMLCTCQ